MLDNRSCFGEGLGLSKEGISLRVWVRAELRIANWDEMKICLEINNKLDAWNALKIIYRETRLLTFAHTVIQDQQW